MGLEDPVAQRRRLAIAPLESAAVAALGCAHRAVHLVVPRSGGPAPELAVLAVVSDDLAGADVEATAAFVLRVAGVDWLIARGRTGVVVTPDGSARAFGPA